MYLGKNNTPDPSANVCDVEFKRLFVNFCSLVCILHNKKLNLANIFLLLLKDKKILELYKLMCDFDNNFEALRYFLEYDSSLHKSKYIKKYLNTENKKRNPNIISK